MNRSQRPASLALFILAVAAACALAAPGTAAASEPYTFTILLESSLGGPVQESSGGADAGLDNSGFQLGLSVIGRGDVRIGGRLGSMDFDDGLGRLADASIDYVNVGGEYRFREGFYDSGVYIGLGHYEIEGMAPNGTVETESSLGLALGLTGEFEIRPRFGVILELTGHITDLATEELFVTGHLGLAFHF